MLFVIVPAFDEAPRIGRVLSTLPKGVDEVIVVDDASRDATAEVARRCGATVIVHEENRGVGAAIASGYRRALSRGEDERDVFVVMAGDGQMDPSDLPALLDPIQRGDADYVKGDRFRHPDKLAMPRARRWGGLVFSWATSRAIGRPISDSQCGYTAITRRACRRLNLDELWPGYGYPNDLLSQLALRDLRIAEVPVRPVYADEVSKLRPRHLGRIAWLVGRAWARRRIADRRRGRRE
jgi:glycosyltransferase involved in cell wall biosynthesis